MLGRLLVLLHGETRDADGNSNISRASHHEQRRTRTCNSCKAAAEEEAKRCWYLVLQPEPSLLGSIQKLSTASAIADFYCSNCGRRGAATVQDHLISLPRILVIQLQRTGYIPNPRNKKGTGTNTRECCEVTVPLDGVDMAALMPGSSGDGTPTYNLMGVCKHIGVSSVGGHYTATCRLGDGSWRTYNDMTVSIPSGAIADGSEACLLFYIQNDTGADSAVGGRKPKAPARSALSSSSRRGPQKGGMAWRNSGTAGSGRNGSGNSGRRSDGPRGRDHQGARRSGTTEHRAGAASSRSRSESSGHSASRRHIGSRASWLPSAAFFLGSGKAKASMGKGSSSGGHNGLGTRAGSSDGRRNRSRGPQQMNLARSARAEDMAKPPSGSSSSVLGARGAKSGGHSAGSSLGKGSSQEWGRQ